jgi:hypothetical protein
VVAIRQELPVAGVANVVRSRIPPRKTIDRSSGARPRTRMAIDIGMTEWSDLHMIVLGTVMHHAVPDAEDIAQWLCLPVPLVKAVCAELKAAGLLEIARGH